MKHKELLTTYLVLTSTAAKELDSHAFNVSKFEENQKYEIVGGFTADQNGNPVYSVKAKRSGINENAINALPLPVLSKYTEIREAIDAWENGDADFPFDLVSAW